MNTAKNNQKIRFIAIGVINTCLDFGILFALKSLGVPVLGANIASTTVAFCFSFFANRKYTFKSSGGDVRRQIILFTIVTLTGLWGVQSLVIALISPVATDLLGESTGLIIAKLCATVASLTWNYMLYSRVVFKKP